MRNLLIAFALMFALISCKDTGKKTTDTDVVAEEAYEVPTITIAEFNADAGKYLDKEVKVKGIVDHVCKHGGKKIFFVDNEEDLHINSETRFEEDLNGSKLIVTGIVREFRVDESYCLQMEEDNIKSHEAGDMEIYNQKKETIKYYRDSMAIANTDHLSYYSLDYVSHVEQ
jgi:hypothetical protein